MKRAKKIIGIIVTLVLALICIYNIYNIINTKVLKNDLTTIRGYAVLEVVSGSMEPKIKVGDMILIDTSEQRYKENDIVTFYDKEGSFVTHRIISIKDGVAVTKGDNNDSIDNDGVPIKEIVGKYRLRLPYLGKILASFRSPFTIIMILLIGVLLCVLISTDSNGNAILDENEQERLEFEEYLKNKEKTEENSKKDIPSKKVEVEKKVSSSKKKSTNTKTKKSTKTTTKKTSTTKTNKKPAGTTAKKKKTASNKRKEM